MKTWLQIQVNKNPDKLFIQDREKTYSYIETAYNVQSFSIGMKRLGILKADRIFIDIPNSIELIELILACFEIGAIAIPVSQKITNGNRTELIKLLSPKLIITNWKKKKKYNYKKFTIE